MLKKRSLISKVVPFLKAASLTSISLEGDKTILVPSSPSEVNKMTLDTEAIEGKASPLKPKEVIRMRS